MTDRQPLHPGRVKLVPVAGQENVYDMVRADEALVPGTELKKATLLSDETERFIWGDAKDRTVDEALYTAKKNTNHVFEVGDIRVTARTDLGDDWLLCNGERIPYEYTELRNNCFPADFMVADWVKFYALDKKIVAFVDDYFYAVKTKVWEDSSTPKFYTVEVYRAKYPDFDFQLVHSETVEYTASYSTKPSMGVAGFYNNKFMLPLSHYVGTTKTNFLYEIGINELGSKGKITQITLPTNVSFDNFVVWYNGSYYFMCNDTTDEIPCVCYGSDLSTTLNKILIDITYNTSYSYGAKFADIKNGIFYFAYDRRGSGYLGAFNVAQIPSTISVVYKGDKDDAGHCFGFYSKALDTIFMGVGASPSSPIGYFYRYDKATNGLVAWDLFGSGSSALVTGGFSDAIENGEDLVLIQYSYIYIVKNYTTNPTVEKIATLSTARPSTDSHTPEAARNSGYPIFSGDHYVDSVLPTITTDGAYNYIRGRVTE